MEARWNMVLIELLSDFIIFAMFIASWVLFGLLIFGTASMIHSELLRKAERKSD